MTDVPENSNLFASLTTTKSQEALAGVYRAAGWEVRKCNWTDFEARSPFAELVIEADNPILVHGPVAGPGVNVDAVIGPLRDAGVGYSCECYDENRLLLLERRWKPTEGARTAETSVAADGRRVGRFASYRARR